MTANSVSVIAKRSRGMKRTVAMKIGLLFFATFCGAVVTLAFSYSYFVKTAHNIAVVNVAGRQQMLSQILHKYANMVHSGQGEDREDLRKFIAEFENALEALEHGGKVAGGCSSRSGCHDYTLPLPRPEVLSGIGEVRQLWTVIKPSLIIIADKPVADPRSQEAFELIKSKTDQLTAATNRVVMAIHVSDFILKERILLVIVATAIFALCFIITGIWMVRRYITERKRAEETTQRQNEFINNVIESLSHPFYVIDANDYTIKMANSAAGFSRVSGSITCYALTHKNTEPCNTTEHPCPLEVVKKTKKPVTVEHIHYDKESNPRIVEVHGYPVFDREGTVVQVIEYSLDITERKQAEAKLRESEEMYRSLIESINLGIAMISPRMEVLSVNSQMKRWFPNIEVSKRPLCYEVLRDPPESEICPGCPTVKTLKDGTVHETVAEMVAGDEVKRYRVISSPIRDAENKVTAATETVEDITDKLRLEEELAKADKLESVGVLAGGIAHDFNNILTAVIGNVSLARMKIEPGTFVGEALEEAEKASYRARDLTKQMLTLSRGGAPILKATSIAGVIRESADFALHGSNVSCKFSMLDDLYTVEIDEGQISQVVSNLVINACQAMPDGGTITISCENVLVEEEGELPLQPGNYVRITVQDQGTGISEDHIRRVFDPFFTTKERGSGLGLATSYSIIKKHGGHIAVKSEVDVGSTFIIYLPASEKSVQSKKTSEEAPKCGSGRVLVMDDEEAVRKLLDGFLSHLGYEAEFSHDGTEAVARYRNAFLSGNKFDAVILDLTVPGGMGGKEAIEKLREIDPEVKVIVSSGYSNDPVLADYETYGFCGQVAKPYEARELARVLHDVLTRTAMPA